MRIGLLTQYYKPEMGAPQNRLYEMVRGLREAGNDICVVTAMPNYPAGRIADRYRGRFRCTETLDGVEVRRYWLYASNAKRALPRIWSMLSFSLTSFCSLFYLRRKRLDCLIVESPPLTLAYTGRWLAKLAGAKFVANISDLWPLSAKELGALSGDGAFYRFLERIERNIYRNSCVAMGQSAEIVDYIRKHGGSEVYLFRNGVDPARFAGLAATRKANGGKFSLVYAGLLGFAQGILDICNNVDFKALGAEFHIYGDGGERTQIERLIAGRPDSGIYYHGVVSRDELPQKLLQHDMTLIPLVKNIYGAVPSKIYESMAAGLPIMFMGEGEGARIVEDHSLGIVAKAKDYAALRKGIAYATSHPDELAQMKDNCKRQATEKFNRPKQIKALDEYLKSKIIG